MSTPVRHRLAVGALPWRLGAFPRGVWVIASLLRGDSADPGGGRKGLHSEPRDPEDLVEKRRGFGYTLNKCSKMGKVAR